MDSGKLSAIVESLRQIGTDKQRIEVKSGVGKSVLETLSAFSNGDGGMLIVGLSESDGFSLVDAFDAGSQRDKLMNSCKKLTPVVRPEIDIVPFESGALLVAELDPMVSHDKPCYVTERGRYGGSYIRTGDGDLRLQKYEIDRLIEEKTQPSWDAEVVPGARISDLDEEVLQNFISSQRIQRPRTFANGEAVAKPLTSSPRSSETTVVSVIQGPRTPNSWVVGI
ncbi:MAG: AlbA family DNA-binding domain-containing protein [Ancrocorticia sp.]|uniref:AlbA family DNA-binding domain-containing protein n=1 Tax=Ancrocorticia sp. TaxID=2593684 RepID=UPI003F8E1772